MIKFLRIPWTFTAAGIFVMLVASIPGFIDYLYRQQTGVSPEFNIAWGLFINFIPAAVFYVVGVLIYLRKPSDGMVVFTSFTLLIFISIFPSINLSFVLQFPLLAALNLCALVCMMVLLYVFPTGQFVPGWTRYAVIAWTGMILLAFIVQVPAGEYIGLAALMLWISTTVYAQLYRLRRAASHGEQQQIKWVMYGALTAIITCIAFFTLNAILLGMGLPEPLRFVFVLILGTAACLATALVPLSIGLAVLRFRLWEIDFIINQTMLYGSLTGLLALAYCGAVILFQQIVLLLTGGSDSSFAVAVSTLLIALLFQPFRRYLQTLIDSIFQDEETQPVVVQPAGAAPIMMALEEPLSEREVEVLTLIAAGMTNGEIAQKLFITEGTVKRHTTNIYNKMAVRNRTQAVARGRESGILP